MAQIQMSDTVTVSEFTETELSHVSRAKVCLVIFARENSAAPLTRGEKVYDITYLVPAGSRLLQIHHVETISAGLRDKAKEKKMFELIKFGSFSPRCDKRRMTIHGRRRSDGKWKIIS